MDVGGSRRLFFSLSLLLLFPLFFILKRSIFFFLFPRQKNKRLRGKTVVIKQPFVITDIYFFFSRFISLFDTNLIKSRRSTPFFLCWLDGWDIYLRSPDCLLLFGLSLLSPSLHERTQEEWKTTKPIEIKIQDGKRCIGKRRTLSPLPWCPPYKTL